MLPLSSIGSTGTIVAAYNASFEKSVIESLATSLPDMSHRLRSLIPRFWDLLDIFLNHYIDPAFGRSNSIKAILPVLCPDLSYKEMEVQDGSSAQVAWLNLINTDSAIRKDKLAPQLRAYCHLDTLAMVRVYQFLHTLESISSDSRARGRTILHEIIDRHYQDFVSEHEHKYRETYGDYRFERIDRVIGQFHECADYTKGMARTK